MLAARRILILYASSHGQTKAIARVIADRFRSYGARVDEVDVNVGKPPNLAGYDLAGFGSRVHRGRHAAKLVAYLDRHHRELMQTPTFFFSVSLTVSDRPYLADPGSYISDLVISTSWRPDWAAAFAGALRYREYSWPLRLWMKLRSSRHGHPIDASRDHDFTDWGQVRAFADRIARELSSKPTTRTRPQIHMR